MSKARSNVRLKAERWTNRRDNPIRDKIMRNKSLTLVDSPAYREF